MVTQAPSCRDVLLRQGVLASAYFAELKRAEFFVWHGAVSPWEIEHYLTAC
jgi:glutamine synthetase